jgi:2-polyprenyl-3-methyl-5-hydroxy-6-metoxy-1,4-benzoquinol methylase
MHVSQMQKFCGYEMRIADSDLQAYLQRWPFATGPDPVRNLIGCAAIRKTLQPRQPSTASNVVMLAPEQTLLATQESQRVQNAFRALHFDVARQRTLNNDFAWEVNQVPRSSRKVLVIGCGDGMELLFLRSILPQANITAIDYRDSLTPEVKALVNLVFLEGDFRLYLDSLAAGDYDLIFSNHTLEHLYAPDETIKILCGLLAPGGSLISTLPMDANPGSPFLSKVARIAAAKAVHPLDLVFLDAGHPWKTNPADLNRTLHAAGFNDVRIYQRAKHLSRYVAGGRLRLETGKKVGLALHALFFGTTRNLAKALFHKRAPARICRILLAMERRVWFGSNNLKNYYTYEALIHATK